MSVDERTVVDAASMVTAGITHKSAVEIRYTLRQAADAVRAGESELAENMIHRALAEIETYIGD